MKTKFLFLPLLVSMMLFAACEGTPSVEEPGDDVVPEQPAPENPDDSEEPDDSDDPNDPDDSENPDDPENPDDSDDPDDPENPEVDPAENMVIRYESADGHMVEFTNLAFGAGVSFISNSFDGTYGTITFSGEVTEIGDDAFYDCEHLKRITIPQSVTRIGNRAFCYCTSLEEITLPKAVTAIGMQAFYGCSEMKTVTVEGTLTECGYGNRNQLFAYCSSLASFVGPQATVDGRGLAIDGRMVGFAPAGITAYTIPAGVTTIADVFQGSSEIESVAIPDYVTGIENFAFAGCPSLREFNCRWATEDKRALVKDGVFNHFAPAGVREYEVPYGVTALGSSAFDACSMLMSITVPETVTKLGAYTFYNCLSLQTLTFKSKVPPTVDLEGYDFYTFFNLRGKIYVPTESYYDYITAPYWSEYADNFNDVYDVLITLPASNDPVSNLYYQTGVNWVYDHIDTKLGAPVRDNAGVYDSAAEVRIGGEKPAGNYFVSSYGNDEYYSGFHAYYHEINFRTTLMRAQYQYDSYQDPELVAAGVSYPGDGFGGMTDDECRELMLRRSQFLMGKVLEILNPDAVSGHIYRVELTLYMYSTYYPTMVKAFLYKVNSDGTFTFFRMI